MTGNRVDPTVASYLLKVDNYISLFIRNAAFTSLTSLHFDISSGVDQNFFKHAQPLSAVSELVTDHPRLLVERVG